MISGEGLVRTSLPDRSDAVRSGNACQATAKRLREAGQHILIASPNGSPMEEGIRDLDERWSERQWTVATGEAAAEISECDRRASIGAAFNWSSALATLTAVRLLPNEAEIRGWADGARETFERVGAKAVLGAARRVPRQARMPKPVTRHIDGGKNGGDAV